MQLTLIIKCFNPIPYLIDYAISITNYSDNSRPILSNSKVSITYIINDVNMITNCIELKMFIEQLQKDVTFFGPMQWTLFHLILGVKVAPHFHTMGPIIFKKITSHIHPKETIILQLSLLKHFNSITFKIHSLKPNLPLMSKVLFINLAIKNSQASKYTHSQK